MARRPHHAVHLSTGNELGQTLITNRSQNSAGEIIAVQAQKIVDNLVAKAEWLNAQRNAHPVLGILGTSIAGS